MKVLNKEVSIVVVSNIIVSSSSASSVSIISSPADSVQWWETKHSNLCSQNARQQHRQTNEFQ